MDDQRRRPTPSLAVVLCVSLCFTSGQTLNNTSYFNSVQEQWTEQSPAKHFTSTNGVPCYDGCEKRGKSYYWCHSPDGWGYCSPSNNVDYQGNDCDTPCGDYGDYSECYLKKGEWGKCGRVEPIAMIHYTIHQEQCTGECQYHKSKEYFWCYTINGKCDYCSPLLDYTYYDEPCRQGSKCETRGQSYSSCSTSKGWDYCGVVGPGECRYSQSNRLKRQVDNPDITCSAQDDDNMQRPTFVDIGGQDKIKETTKKLRNEALDLINQWDNQHLCFQARSNLIRSPNLRIDNQGLANNRLCHNLQIQINGQRRPGKSTTISHVICPFDTSAELVRLAFRESLWLRTSIEVRDSTRNNNNNNKCLG